MTEGDENIKWAEAREKEDETYAGYLNDLTYIWDYAEKEQNYLLAIRCMLIQNSINSIHTNFPAELVRELAETNLLSYSACLNLISQFDDDKCAKSLALVSPNLPESYFQRALFVASNLRSIKFRLIALSSLISYAPKNIKKQILNDVFRELR